MSVFLLVYLLACSFIDCLVEILSVIAQNAHRKC